MPKSISKTEDLKKLSIDSLSELQSIHTTQLFVARQAVEKQNLC